MIDYKKYIVWQKSHELAVDIYKMTGQFPKSEMFGLASQMQRCAVSVPSNIAEGFERHTSKDFSHFLVIARGSCAELRAQLLIARDLGYISADRYTECNARCIEISKIITAFRKKLTTTTND